MRSFRPRAAGWAAGDRIQQDQLAEGDQFSNPVQSSMAAAWSGTAPHRLADGDRTRPGQCQTATRCGGRLGQRPGFGNSPSCAVCMGGGLPAGVE